MVWGVGVLVLECACVRNMKGCLCSLLHSKGRRLWKRSKKREGAHTLLSVGKTERAEEGQK